MREDASVAGAGTAGWSKAAILIYVERLTEERRRQISYRSPQVYVIKQIQKAQRELQCITLRFRAAEYAGSERNGVNSRDYGQWDGSFRLDKADEAGDAAPAANPAPTRATIRTYGFSAKDEGRPSR